MKGGGGVQTPEAPSAPAERPLTASERQRRRLVHLACVMCETALCGKPGEMREWVETGVPISCVVCAEMEPTVSHCAGCGISFWVDV